MSNALVAHLGFYDFFHNYGLTSRYYMENLLSKNGRTALGNISGSLSSLYYVLASLYMVPDIEGNENNLLAQRPSDKKK